MPWNQVKEVECFIEGLYKIMKEIASFCLIGYNACFVAIGCNIFFSQLHVKLQF